MPVTICPSRAELAALAAGKLSPQALERMAPHLESCGECLSALQALAESADPLLPALRRSGPPDPFAAEPACARAVARFEALAREPSTMPPGPGGESTPQTRETPRLPPPAPAAVPGLELGQYRLLDKLGEGGMGAVYRALHRKLERVVALKVLPAARMNDPQAVARFHQEMKAIGKLDHSHIVRATDAGEAGGVHFLVMELLEGIDLARLVKRGPLPLPDACEVIRQAALGLQHAHEHGLVHRDIKPSNLMLTPSPPPLSPAAGERGGGEGGGQVKVLDLGLALLQGGRPAGQELTASGQIMGTVDYMAPEQAFDTHRVDIRADIYSLGCTLYHLLAGKPPFSGPEYDTHGKKMLAHAQVPAPPIRSCRPEVPAALAAQLERMLAKNPADRFTTPADVAAALEPFTAGCNLPKLLAAADEVAAPQPQPRSRPRPVIPKRLLAASAAALALLILGFVVFSAYRLWFPPAPAVLENLDLYVVRDGQTRPDSWGLVRHGEERANDPINPPLSPRDWFKLDGGFDRPTYWYLLWFDTQGQVEVVAYSEGKQAVVRCPARDSRALQLKADAPAGIHLLLLVAGSVAPEQGKDLLTAQLAGMAKPPEVLPPRWAVHLRGHVVETDSVAIPLVSDYLREIKARMPAGLELVHALFLETVQ